MAAADVHGLTHIALAVRDLDRTVDFYTRAFGVREYYRDGESAQVLGPGPHDVLAFEHDPERAGKAGGAIHFGFRLTRPPADGSRSAAISAATRSSPSSRIRTATRSSSGTRTRRRWSAKWRGPAHETGPDYAGSATRPGTLSSRLILRRSDCTVPIRRELGGSICLRHLGVGGARNGFPHIVKGRDAQGSVCLAGCLPQRHHSLVLDRRPDIPDDLLRLTTKC